MYAFMQIIFTDMHRCTNTHKGQLGEMQVRTKSVKIGSIQLCKKQNAGMQYALRKQHGYAGM